MSIKNFKDKKLERCWKTGECSGIEIGLKRRLLHKLDYLDAAMDIDDLKFPPSNRLHKLKGKLSEYHTISISGAWRLLFKFKNGNAYKVHYVNYH